jgi:hypothetical protein
MLDSMAHQETTNQKQEKDLSVGFDFFNDQQMEDGDS